MKNPFSQWFGKGKTVSPSGSGTVLRGSGASAPAGAPAVGAPPAEAGAVWTPGSTVLNDYQVLGQLGQGSFGHVYLLVSSQSTRQRFAVKRAFIAGEQQRRLFLDELKNWIDLPEHPHLVSCRFFRTAGSEIVIFADYVDGGDLSKWIAAGKLKSLESILDVAIQFAWGLHAAHELGVIHQDVKPGNALMTPQRVVRVADFGLARARSRPGGEAEYGGGYTEAYCSPEQRIGEELSSSSDLWSWAVSVMEMLAGGLKWQLGFEAAAVLDQFIRAQPALPNGQPAFPKPITDVLQRCFFDAPEYRWPTLLAAAQALEASYHSLTGQAYPRSAPQFPGRDPRRADLDRRAGGTSWDDPREWLEKGLQAVGRDPAEIERIAHSGQDVQSLKAQAVADLGNYQQAQLLFEQAIATGRPDLRGQLAALCMNRALVHCFVEDAPGALHCFDTAIAIYERLVNQEGQRESASVLATAYMNKAAAGRPLGNTQAAVALYDQCIAIRERLVNQEGRRELAPDLATAYMNKAIAVGALGSPQAAVALYDQCIAILERLTHREGRRELAPDLATAYVNKAIAVRLMGNLKGTLALHDRCIAIREHLVHQEGRRELAPDLAAAYMNKANAVYAVGNPQAAVTLFDQSIVLYERLVHQEGRRELARDLAAAYLNKANAVYAVGNPQAAVTLFDQSIVLYERLVRQEGRHELAPELAMAYMNKAVAVGALGDLAAAVALYDQCIAIRERLVRDRRELAPDLAAAYMNKANATSEMDNLPAAMALYEQCIAILESLVSREGRRELAGDLAWAQAALALALKRLGDRDRAGSLARTAIAALEAEIQRTQRADLQRVLEGTQRTLADVLGASASTPGGVHPLGAGAGAEAATRSAAVGRNEPCPCGSGRRYKQCHGALPG